MNEAGLNAKWLGCDMSDPRTQKFTKEVLTHMRNRLSDYLEEYPASRHSDEIGYMIGSVHFERGEYEKAIFWFNEADIDMLSPEQQEAYSFRLAYSLLQTGEMEKARGYFARIEQIGD